MGVWWAECGTLALERDGTVWRLTQDAAIPVGHIDNPGGIRLTDAEANAWESLRDEWEDAIDAEHSNA